MTPARILLGSVEKTMFTGLVQHVGTIEKLLPLGQEAELTVAAPFENVELGESIAVMGACLTVTKFETGRFTVFASMETLSKTGIGNLAVGTPVNLERALRVGDPIGGHLVTGHVDDRVKLLSVTPSGQAQKLSFGLPKPPLGSHLASKGSITLDGVSLTVNEVRADSFDVMIIPLTLKHTTLGQKKPGDLINIETDVLAKYVARQVARDDEQTTGIDAEFLSRTGFMR